MYVKILWETGWSPATRSPSLAAPPMETQHRIWKLPDPWWPLPFVQTWEAAPGSFPEATQGRQIRIWVKCLLKKIGEPCEPQGLWRALVFTLRHSYFSPFLFAWFGDLFLLCFSLPASFLYYFFYPLNRNTLEKTSQQNFSSSTLLMGKTCYLQMLPLGF